VVRTEFLQKPQEVDVFADEHRARVTRRQEDTTVGGVPQLKITNRYALNREARSDP
jgi:hypothetical protein